jgi:phage terminase small subunit
MPVLKNARHERFAQEIAKGESQTKAYLAAGYAVPEETARRAASKLMTKHDISARVSEILGRGAERAAVTIASIIEELEEARLAAQRNDQPAAMVAATMGKAKVAGLLTEKVEHSGRMTLGELVHASMIGFAAQERNETKETVN